MKAEFFSLKNSIKKYIFWGIFTYHLLRKKIGPQAKVSIQTIKCGNSKRRKKVTILTSFLCQKCSFLLLKYIIQSTINFKIIIFQSMKKQVAVWCIICKNEWFPSKSMNFIFFTLARILAWGKE